MACNLLALLAWVALVTLHTLALHNVDDGHTYPRLVEPTSNAYSLRFAHGVGLLPLPLLKRTFPFRHL
jgi:hypothetical protein